MCRRPVTSCVLMSRGLQFDSLVREGLFQSNIEPRPRRLGFFPHPNQRISRHRRNLQRASKRQHYEHLMLTLVSQWIIDVLTKKKKFRLQRIIYLGHYVSEATYGAAQGTSVYSRHVLGPAVKHTCSGSGPAPARAIRQETIITAMCRTDAAEEGHPTTLPYT
jgi:hypothetical protein